MVDSATITEKCGGRSFCASIRSSSTMRIFSRKSIALAQTSSRVSSGICPAPADHRALPSSHRSQVPPSGDPFLHSPPQSFQRLSRIGLDFSLRPTRTGRSDLALDHLGALAGTPCQEALDRLDRVDNLLLGHALDATAVLHLHFPRH